MFKEALRDIVERTDGSIAGLLMGFDGITVEHYQRTVSALDVETIGMEYSVILQQVAKAAELLDAGAAQELSISAERLTTVIRVVNDEYFVAMALGPRGNTGKGRFLLRTLAPRLLAELI
jgi:predicted regulator of Ras-like GTPase activity (Roadblock/LC7/MglB family)